MFINLARSTVRPGAVRAPSPAPGPARRSGVGADHREVVMDEKAEAAYRDGQRYVWRSMIAAAAQHLGITDPDAARLAWVVERGETVALLRRLCEDLGDNDWPDDLHLADVIEKHLARHLISNHSPGG
jgi:hypothetical protein